MCIICHSIYLPLHRDHKEIVDFLNFKFLIKMAEETKTYVFGNDSGTGFGPGFVPGMLMGAGNNGWGGFGTNSIGDLIALAIVASIFGWGGNGWGGFGGNNSGVGAAGFLSNQISDSSTRELILQAINGTDADVRQLASTLNVDVESLKTGLNTVNSAIASVAAQNGMSSLQVINAIQAGNASLASQLSTCCCENRLLTTQQGYEAQIRTLEQTNQLGSQADRNTNALLTAINAQTVAMNDGFCEIKERELQDKIDALTAQNTTLRGQIDNATQTAQIAGLLAPIQAEVNAIKASMPNTVPVTWPNITAVSTTPYMGYYGNFNGWGYGNSGSYWG